MNRTLLVRAGIDYDSGVERMQGDKAFFEELLTLFLEDAPPKFFLAQKAFSTGSYRELFERVHELKGASGNLNMTSFYNACCVLVELLRNDPEDADPVEVAKAYRNFTEAYGLVYAAIEDAAG